MATKKQFIPTEDITAFLHRHRNHLFDYFQKKWSPETGELTYGKIRSLLYNTIVMFAYNFEKESDVTWAVDDVEASNKLCNDWAKIIMRESQQCTESTVLTKMAFTHIVKILQNSENPVEGVYFTKTDSAAVIEEAGRILAQSPLKRKIEPFEIEHHKRTIGRHELTNKDKSGLTRNLAQEGGGREHRNPGFHMGAQVRHKREAGIVRVSEKRDTSGDQILNNDMQDTSYAYMCFADGFDPYVTVSYFQFDEEDPLKSKVKENQTDCVYDVQRACEWLKSDGNEIKFKVRREKLEKDCIRFVLLDNEVGLDTKIGGASTRLGDILYLKKKHHFDSQSGGGDVDEKEEMLEIEHESDHRDFNYIRRVDGKWQACININEKNKTVNGIPMTSAEEAARDADRILREYNCDLRRLNWPKQAHLQLALRRYGFFSGMLSVIVEAKALEDHHKDKDEYCVLKITVQQGTSLKKPRSEDAMVDGSRAVGSIVLFILYLCMVGFLFAQIEKDEPESDINDWWDGFWFAYITATTVGYGDLSPATELGLYINSLCMLLDVIFLGYLMSLAFDYVANKMEKNSQEVREHGWRDEHGHEAICEWLFEKNTSTKWKTELARENTKRLIEEREETCFDEWWMTYGPYVTYVLLIAVFVFGGCLVWHLQEEFDMQGSFHFCFVTMSTVGYGDISPGTDEGKAVCIFYIITGVGLLARLGSMICDSIVDKQSEKIAEKILQEGLMHFDQIAEMDIDGKGEVDRYEFTRAILIHQGKAKMADFVGIKARFKELDVDDSGFIDKDDFILFAQKEKEREEEARQMKQQ